jgi:hypothetical protein
LPRRSLKITSSAKVSNCSCQARSVSRIGRSVQENQPSFKPMES